MTGTLRPPRTPHTKDGTMMQTALKLCERMASAAVEFRLITRLPLLVEEYSEAYRALREPEQVRALLDIDPELLDHAYMQLHRIVVAAVDEASRNFVEGLDRDGWREVLLVALEVDDPPANVVDLNAYLNRARENTA